VLFISHKAPCPGVDSRHSFYPAQGRRDGFSHGHSRRGGGRAILAVNLTHLALTHLHMFVKEDSVFLVDVMANKPVQRTAETSHASEGNRFGARTSAPAAEGRGCIAAVA